MSVVERAKVLWIDEDRDRGLLRDFVERGLTEAFGELHRRHIGMVYRTCLRELGNPDLAADAAQATFVAFAKRAACLPRQVVVSGWLFKAALLTARQIRRSELRRSRRERVATEHQSPPAWNDIEPAINAALAKLPQQDRDVIILRYFEGRDFREAGVAMQVSENAARMRHNRALERLRRSLGLSSAVTLGTILTEESKSQILPRLLSPAVAAGAPGIGLFKFAVIGLVVLGGATVGTVGYRSVKGDGMAVSPAVVAGRATISSPIVEDAPVQYQANLEVTFKSGGNTATRSAHYWRIGDKWRLTEVTDSKRKIDGEGDRSRIRTLATLDTVQMSNEVRAVFASPDRRFTECDPWEWSLFRLPNMVISKPMPPNISSKEALSYRRGTADHFILSADGGRTYQVTLDIAHSERISRVTVTTRRDSMTFKTEFKVLAWTNVPGGNDMPQKIQRTDWFNGQVSEESTAVISDIKCSDVHLPAMPSPLRGSLMMDETKSMTFPIDENWKIIGAGVPVKDVSVSGGGRRL